MILQRPRIIVGEKTILRLSEVKLSSYFLVGSSFIKTHSYSLAFLSYFLYVHCSAKLICCHSRSALILLCYSSCILLFLGCSMLSCKSRVQFIVEGNTNGMRGYMYSYIYCTVQCTRCQSQLQLLGLLSLWIDCGTIEYICSTVYTWSLVSCLDGAWLIW